MADVPSGIAADRSQTRFQGDLEGLRLTGSLGDGLQHGLAVGGAASFFLCLFALGDIAHGADELTFAA